MIINSKGSVVFLFFVEGWVEIVGFRLLSNSHLKRLVCDSEMAGAVALYRFVQGCRSRLVHLRARGS